MKVPQSFGVELNEIPKLDLPHIFAGMLRFL